MQRQIGRIQIDHDLLGRFLVSFEEDVHQQFVDATRIVMDLLVAISVARFSGQLQTVQGAFAR